VVKARPLTVGFIVKSDSGLQESELRFHGATREGSFCTEDRKMANMARKCHRQKTQTHFIFIAEQFLGGGLHWASQDS
jgi:hypothetical protein